MLSKLKNMLDSITFKAGILSGLLIAWITCEPLYVLYYSSTKEPEAFLDTLLFCICLILSILLLNIKRFAPQFKIRKLSVISSITLFIITVLNIYISPQTVLSALLASLSGILCAVLLNTLFQIFINTEYLVVLISLTIIIGTILFICVDIQRSLYQSGFFLGIIISMFPLTSAFVFFKFIRDDDLIGKKLASNEYNAKKHTVNMMIIYIILALIAVTVIYWIGSYSFWEQSLKPLGNFLYIYLLGFTLYIAALIVLVVLLKNTNYLYLPGFALSALGMGFTVLLSTYGIPYLSIICYFIFIAAAAGADLFYWFSIWSIARLVNNKIKVAIGLIAYLTSITMVNLISSFELKLPGGSYLSVLAAIFVIFILLPLFMRNARSLKLLELTNNTETAFDENNFIKHLTPSEIRVLKLICSKYSNTDIANTLFISLNTVKFHVRNIFKKATHKTDMNFRQKSRKHSITTL